MVRSSYIIESSRICFSTEDYRDATRGFYSTKKIIEEKLILPDWFYLLYCVDFKEYREFSNNVCPNHSTHKVSLSYEYCGNVYNDYFF